MEIPWRKEKPISVFRKIRKDTWNFAYSGIIYLIYLSNVFHPLSVFTEYKGGRHLSKKDTSGKFLFFRRRTDGKAWTSSGVESWGIGTALCGTGIGDCVRTSEKQRFWDGSRGISFRILSIGSVVSGAYTGNLFWRQDMGWSKKFERNAAFAGKECLF